MKPTISCCHVPQVTAAALLSCAVASAETLMPVYDSRADTSSTAPLSRDTTSDLAIGLVSEGRAFRTYLTFDLSGESAATGETTLVLTDRGANENNTSSEAQTFSLFVLSADWDGVDEPGPVGTTVATVSFTPATGNDTQTITFTSTELTAAFNDALGGELYLGVMSDVEGTAARSFKWLGSLEDSGSEPELSYTPDDGTPPTLVPPTDPADDATGVLVGTGLTATFDEPIALQDGGTVTIDNLDGGPDTVMTLPDSQVSVSGSDLIIVPVSPLAVNTNYAIKISGDAIKDVAAPPTFFAGITDDTTWNFQTAGDSTAPGLVLPTTPPDGATGVAVESNLVASFDEAIAAGTGNITIRNLSTSDDTVIAVGDARVSVSGTTLTVDPAANLDPNNDYAILIDAGAVTDLVGNPFAGIGDETTWSFTTAADTAAPVIVSLSPADGGVSPATAALVAGFDEEIAAVPPTVVLSEDFESGDGGFTVETAAGTDWAHGTPDSESPGGTVDSGNGADSGFGTCWGTNLGSYNGFEGDSGFYADPTTTCLRSVPIDLTGATSAQLSFAHTYDLFDPDDEAVVNIIDDTTDTAIAAAVYTVAPGNSGWTTSPAIDLSPAVGEVVRIEWCLKGTGGTTDDYLGWYVDDVTVTAGTGGGITLKNLTDSTETFLAMDAPGVGIAGTNLTITPPAPLEAGALYAVQIAADALTDLSGNPFAGILDDSTWNFTALGALTPSFDARADTNSAVPLDKTVTTDLAVGPVSAGRYFRTYLTFDLSTASPATGDTTLVLSPAGSESNTSSLEQTFTLFVLDADWDGATQPWPDGTAVATIPFTPETGGDGRGISFTSAALTTAINNALGGELYLGIKSDAEGPDARSFLWMASREDSGFEPQLLFTVDGGSGGDTFASWIGGFFPGETDPAVIGLDADPDGDGNGNGVENFFGTAPDGFSPGLTAGAADAGAGTFRFTHPQGTLAGGLSAAYRWSKDLETFHPEGLADGTTVTFSTEADTPAAGFTTVTATVTGAPVDSLYVRVEVTGN